MTVDAEAGRRAGAAALCLLAALTAPACPEPEPPFVLALEDYEGWEGGGDDWAEGEEVVEVGPSHTGWTAARCFECHGAGAPEAVAGHDDRMQLWSWSCSRGFPGAESCHGHGTNGADPFNHGEDPSFIGCTTSGCHDLYAAGVKDRENHGFMGAPDLFCQACHAPYWETWPE